MPSPDTTRRPWARLLIFPLVVLILFAGLVATGITGSSLGAIATAQQRDQSLLAGTPRTIRSDEFMVSAPLMVSQQRQGLPEYRWIGLTDTDVNALGLAVKQPSLSSVFEPWNWGYYFLPVENGFAWWWWTGYALALLVLYALFLVLGTRIIGAISFAAVATFTPYNAWWSSAQPTTVLALTAGSVLAVMLAAKARTWWATVLGGLAAGAFLAANVLFKYPPWTVSLLLVSAGFLVGYLIDQRVKLTRLLVIALSGIGVAVVAIIPWLVANAPALQAMANTYYPGRRESLAGVDSLLGQMTSPFSVWFSFREVYFASGTNLSEIARPWLPLPVIAATALFVLWLVLRKPLRQATPAPSDSAAETGQDTPTAVIDDTQPPPSTGIRQAPSMLWTLLGTALMSALLLAWAVMPLPAWVGQVTFLSMVPPTRIGLALSFGALLIAGMSATLVRYYRVGIAGIVLFGLGVGVWVVIAIPLLKSITILGLQLNSQVLAYTYANVAIIGAGFVGLALCTRRFFALVAALFAVYALLAWSVVNPWYQGIAPLNSVDQVMPQQLPEHSRIAVLGNEVVLTSILRASDDALISGMTLYPNRDYLNAVAGDQEELWNNFAHIIWFEAPGSPPTFTRTGLDSVELRMDPCSAEIRQLHVDAFATSQELESECLVELDRINFGDNTYLWYVYAN